MRLTIRILISNAYAHLASPADRFLPGLMVTGIRDCVLGDTLGVVVSDRIVEKTGDRAGDIIHKFSNERLNRKDANAQRPSAAGPQPKHQGHGDVATRRRGEC